MLKRLQGARPSGSLRRDNLVSDFNRKFGVSGQMNSSFTNKVKSRSQSAYPTYEQNDLDGDRFDHSYSTNKRNRPQSAYVLGNKRVESQDRLSRKPRPLSAHLGNADETNRRSARPKSAHTYVHKMSAPRAAWEDGW